MTLKLSDVARNMLADTIVNNIASGTCKIYTGTQPASADDAATGTLLATVVFDGSFDAAWLGMAALGMPNTIVDAVASGAPGWARIASSTGLRPFDCTVGLSGADLIINASPIVAGAGVEVVSLSIGFPTL